MKPAHVIPNISDAVLPTITGTVNIPDIEAIGIIETIAAVSSVLVGDIVYKAARVNLLEIRLTRGLGCKDEVFYTGELGALEAAAKAALEKVGNGRHCQQRRDPPSQQSPHRGHRLIRSHGTLHPLVARCNLY